MPFFWYRSTYASVSLRKRLDEPVAGVRLAPVERTEAVDPLPTELELARRDLAVREHLEVRIRELEARDVRGLRRVVEAAPAVGPLRERRPLGGSECVEQSRAVGPEADDPREGRVPAGVGHLELARHGRVADPLEVRLGEGSRLHEVVDQGGRSGAGCGRRQGTRHQDRAADERANPSRERVEHRSASS